MTCQEGGCGACVVALTKQDLSTKKDKIIAVNSVRFIFHFTYFITYFTSITRLENWKDYFIFRAGQYLEEISKFRSQNMSGGSWSWLPLTPRL